MVCHTDMSYPTLLVFHFAENMFMNVSQMDNLWQVGLISNVTISGGHGIEHKSVLVTVIKLLCPT